MTTPDHDDAIDPAASDATASEKAPEPAESVALEGTHSEEIEGAGARDKVRDDEADAIIRTHMNYSMVGGAIPIPLLDLTALTAVQLDLIKRLALHYDAPFDSGSARTFLTSLGAALAGRWMARLGAASLAKLIPGVGFLVGAAAGVTLNGAFTFAVGTVVKHHFATGRPLEELDARQVKDELAALLEAGRKQASAVLDKLRAGKDRSGP